MACLLILRRSKVGHPRVSITTIMLSLFGVYGCFWRIWQHSAVLFQGVWFGGVWIPYRSGIL